MRTKMMRFQKFFWVRVTSTILQNNPETIFFIINNTAIQDSNNFEFEKYAFKRKSPYTLFSKDREESFTKNLFIFHRRGI